MQEHSASNCTFLHRTDQLAARLGINVQDLPNHLGVSRRTVFAARKDDGAASAKTWLKLEEAERKAGVTHAMGELSARLAAAANAYAGTEEEKQRLFEELLAREKTPLVNEILNLRDEVKRLESKIEAATKALKQ